ncbi:MAG: tripartite tricarboxylate transporter substrate-binding protein [Ahrensia sp.]|nr:tripartite tricarboxylate transporter substrate-binding protein [Ahrensia sp.]
MRKLVLTALALGGMVAANISSAFAEWAPPGPIKLTIAFRAGGGADTQARLIAEHLEAEKGWKIIPENVTGKGGINALKALKDQPNDGTAIAIVVTESLGYNLVAAKNSGLSVSDFTPLTTTAGFQMGVVAKTEKGWKTFSDVIEAAKGGQAIRFGVMSPKLDDLAYMLGKAHGVEFNTVMLRGGKGVMNGLNAGDIDVGWGAGIQNAAVQSGDMVNLASGLSTKLSISPDAPTMEELGVKFNADGYFVFVAPAGLPNEARTALSEALSSVAADEATKAGGMIKKAFGGAQIIKGDELDAIVSAAADASAELMNAAE